MEFEKTLFRVHERVLSNESARLILQALFIIFASSGIFFLAFFLYSDGVYRGKSHCFQPQYNDFFEQCNQLNTTNLNDQATLFKISVCRLSDAEGSQDMYYDKCGVQKKFTDSSSENAAQNKSFCEGDQLINMYYSGVGQITTMPEDVKANLNITTVNIFLDAKCYAGNFFTSSLVHHVIGLETILLNEIITTFSARNKNITVKNIDTDETWAWGEKNLRSYRELGLFMRIIDAILDIFKVAVGLFITSAITSIYLKITIVCSPVFIMLLVRCFNCFQPNQANRMAIYRVFPWVGVYLFTLDNQSTPQKIGYLMRSFLLLICLFYAIYVSTQLVIGTYMFFFKSIPQGIDENFYGYQALLEFVVMLFIRTRSAIKWFPKTSVLLTIMYLFYVQQTTYGFYYLAFTALVSLVFAFFCLILVVFEQPAMHWNPTYYYTPSIDRPRTLYFPLFSLNYNNDLPQLWTMFYPLHGRDHFNEAQLSYIDRNYLLLNQVLSGNNNINNVAPVANVLPVQVPQQQQQQQQQVQQAHIQPPNDQQAPQPAALEEQRRPLYDGAQQQNQQHDNDPQAPHLQIEMQQQPLNLLHDFDTPIRGQQRIAVHDEEREQTHYQRLQNDPPNK